MQIVVFLGDLNQRGRIPERQRPQQHRIHDAENGDVRADGECDGEHDCGREQRGFPHDAKGVQEIVHRAIPSGDEEFKLQRKAGRMRRIVMNGGTCRVNSTHWISPGR
ncbi:MAG: hypothetical protein ABSA94_09770 [Acidobacteriaceae bacterium]|jgi:hypothetical protein